MTLIRSTARLAPDWGGVCQRTRRAISVRVRSSRRRGRPVDGADEPFGQRQRATMVAAPLGAKRSTPCRVAAMDGLLDGLDFDPEAVRERYRFERDKRLRDNGADQYIEMAGAFARFAEGDPHVEPGFTRGPIV